MRRTIRITRDSSMKASFLGLLPASSNLGGFTSDDGLEDKTSMASDPKSKKDSVTRQSGIQVFIDENISSERSSRKDTVMLKAQAVDSDLEVVYKKVKKQGRMVSSFFSQAPLTSKSSNQSGIYPPSPIKQIPDQQAKPSKIKELGCNQFFVSNHFCFLRAPVEQGRQLIFTIKPSQGSYKIYFDENQQVLNCILKESLILFESQQGPAFTLLTSTKNHYIASDLRSNQIGASEDLFVIRYEKSNQNDKNFLRTTILSLFRDSTENQDKKAVSYSSRQPGLNKQNGQRLELQIKPRKNIPIRALRPSRYHCVIDDQHGNESCLLIQHDSTYQLWVRSPMTPLIALSCGVSRAEQLRQLQQKQSKSMFACWNC